MLSISAPLVNRAVQALNPVTIASSLYGSFQRWRNVKRYGLVGGTAYTVLSNASWTEVLAVVVTLAKVHKSMRSGMSNTSVTITPLSSNNTPPSRTHGTWLDVVPWKLSALLVVILCWKPRERWGVQTSWLRNIGLSFLSGHLLVVLFKQVMARHNTHVGNELVTKVVNRYLSKPAIACRELRTLVVDHPMVVSKPVKGNHTHPQSAADRTTATNTGVQIARSAGKVPYLIQKSQTNVKNRLDGCRSWYWMKDTLVDPCTLDVKEDNAFVIIDTDYHMDGLPEMLAYYGILTIIYTLTPTKCGVSEGEYQFFFDENNIIKYTVSGGGGGRGAVYEHQLHDYRGDTCTCVCNRGFTRYVQNFHIERKFVDAHHSLVCLIPLSRIVLPRFMPLDLLIAHSPLRRLEVNVGEFNVMDIISKDGMHRNVSRVGSHLSVTLDKSSFDALFELARSTKIAITPSMVESNLSRVGPQGMPEANERLAPGVPHLLTNYIRTTVIKEPARVFPPVPMVNVIHYGKHDHDSKPFLVPIGTPLVPPGYVHVSNINTEDVCVKRRMEQFQTPTTMAPVITPQMMKFIDEFIFMTIPDEMAHTLHPYEEEVVWLRQDRKTQQQILHKLSSSGPTVPTISAHMKKESYEGPSDARLISICAEKLEYSKFIYSFTDNVLGKQPWYAFNKNPREIAQRVCDILNKAYHALLADGSRYDGHVNYLARYFERLLFMRAFHPDHHNSLLKAMEAQFGVTGRTENGRTYKSGYSRASGSLETASANSCGTAIIDYFGKRLDGVPPREAYSKLGIYGGDDSLTANTSPASLAKAATMFGQNYEIEVVQYGGEGINFLNRFFSPEVWFGNPNSMSNVGRAFRKMFFAPPGVVSDTDKVEKLGERLLGYYYMDRNTPGLGQLAKAAVAIIPNIQVGELTPFYGQDDNSWPNEFGEWMLDTFERQLPGFDTSLFDTWITECVGKRDPYLLLQAPMCMPPAGVPVVKVPMAINGEIHLPPVVDPKGKEEDNEEVALENVQAITPASNPSPEETPLSMAEVPKLKVPLMTDKGLKKKTQVVSTPATVTPAAVPKRPVSDWVAPKLKSGETQPEFVKRLSLWEEKKAKVLARESAKAKKQMHPTPVQISGTHGSFTRSDDQASRPLCTLMDEEAFTDTEVGEVFFIRQGEHDPVFEVGISSRFHREWGIRALRRPLQCTEIVLSRDHEEGIPLTMTLHRLPDKGRNASVPCVMCIGIEVLGTTRVAVMMYFRGGTDRLPRLGRSARMAAMSRAAFLEATLRAEGPLTEAEERDPVVVPQIGGSHGEHTMEDDVAGRGRSFINVSRLVLVLLLLCVTFEAVSFISANCNIMTKTKSQKAKAKAAARGRSVPGRSKGNTSNVNRKKKWYLGIDTQWGSLSAGSEAKPSGKRAFNNAGAMRSLDSGLGADTQINAPIRNTNQLIEFDELVGSVFGNTSFECTPHQVQPGLAGEFPWASQFAKLFQEYEFKYLCYYFKPIGSMFATGQARGKVMLVFDCDAVANNLSSIQQANNVFPHVDALITQNACLDIKCVNKKFVRAGNIPAGSDPKTYDLGRLYVVVYGTEDANQIGELHVRYGLQLRKPVLEITGALAPVQTNFKYADFSNSSTAISLAVDTRAPLGTEEANGIGAANSTGIITLQPGMYKISYACYVVTAATSVLLLDMYIVINEVAQSPSWHDQVNHAAGYTITQKSGFVENIVNLADVATLKCVRRVSTGGPTASTLDRVLITVL